MTNSMHLSRGYVLKGLRHNERYTDLLTLEQETDVLMTRQTIDQQITQSPYKLRDYINIIRWYATNFMVNKRDTMWLTYDDDSDDTAIILTKAPQNAWLVTIATGDDYYYLCNSLETALILIRDTLRNERD